MTEKSLWNRLEKKFFLIVSKPVTLKTSITVDKIDFNLKNFEILHAILFY